jgi:hypothetical protein
MNPDLVPPLVFVDDPVHEDAVEALVCPVCWNVTGAWLASPSGRATRLVCEGVFEVAVGVA